MAEISLHNQLLWAHESLLKLKWWTCCIQSGPKVARYGQWLVGLPVLDVRMQSPAHVKEEIQNFKISSLQLQGDFCVRLPDIAFLCGRFAADARLIVQLISRAYFSAELGAWSTWGARIGCSAWSKCWTREGRHQVISEQALKLWNWPSFTKVWDPFWPSWWHPGWLMKSWCSFLVWWSAVFLSFYPWLKKTKNSWTPTESSFRSHH